MRASGSTWLSTIIVRMPVTMKRTAVTVLQRYRFRAPSTGREIILEAEPGRVYVDRETGETLQVVGKVLPLAPSKSRLPWAVENLRFCNWCDALPSSA